MNTSIDCDDGNACTTDGSNATDGCTHEDVDCDDGDACTNDDCDAASGCINIAVDCGDGDNCTTDSCDAATGCSNVAVDCDDGDVCTDDSCDAASGDCVNTTDESNDPSCETAGPDNAFCEVSGNAGDTVICALQMARATEGTATPAAAQLEIHFDSAAVTPVQLQDEACFNIPVPPFQICNVAATPPGVLSPSGHVVNISPTDVADWDAQGFGKVLLSNPSNPAAAISDAFLDGTGAVSGDAQFLELALTLDADIDAANPSILTFEEILGSTENATAMAGSVQDGVIIMSEGGGVDCDSLDCDDGDACTADGCSDISGCTSDSIDCDDGNACTDDSCDASSGCVNSNNNAACDDGDACTAGDACSDGGCAGGAGIS